MQELRDAGAEAIQIGDVRVVAGTWFADTDRGASVSTASSVRPPYVIKAIGDANTLAGAMEIPGGVSATVRGPVATPTCTIAGQGRRSTRCTRSDPPQYARPVPTSTP